MDKSTLRIKAFLSYQALLAVIDAQEYFEADGSIKITQKDENEQQIYSSCFEPDERGSTLSYRYELEFAIEEQPIVLQLILDFHSWEGILSTDSDESIGHFREKWFIHKYKIPVEEEVENNGEGDGDTGARSRQVDISMLTEDTKAILLTETMQEGFGIYVIASFPKDKPDAIEGTMKIIVARA